MLDTLLWVREGVRLGSYRLGPRSLENTESDGALSGNGEAQVLRASFPPRGNADDLCALIEDRTAPACAQVHAWAFREDGAKPSARRQ
jgi:hypothetical protein